MKHAIAKQVVLGSKDSLLTLPSLPPSDTKRWVARRKAEVIAAVHGGLLTMAAACSRYRLSAEEFLEWERHFDKHGLDGLKASVRPTRKRALH